jgi:hypothetical protein
MRIPTTWRFYLPAVPYLVGVGLQVSGVTNIPISVGIFELAALIAAAVVWSVWADWRTTAVTIHGGGRLVDRVRKWNGPKVPLLGCVRTEIIVAILVLLASNAAIVGFIGLAEKRETAAHAESIYATQLTRFYAQLGGLFWMPLKDTPERFDEWTALVDKKEEEIISWVGVNMGPAAQQRLADTHALNVSRGLKFSNAISEKHNQYLVAVWAMQGNLKAMIETRVWDHSDKSPDMPPTGTPQ